MTCWSITKSVISFPNKRVYAESASNVEHEPTSILASGDLDRRGCADAVQVHGRSLLGTRMSPQQQAYLYYALGNAHDAVDRPELSREYLDRSVVIAKEHGLRRLIGDVKSLPRSPDVAPTIRAAIDFDRVGFRWRDTIE